MFESKSERLIVGLEVILVHLVLVEVLLDAPIIIVEGVCEVIVRLVR
jgi:hypothetical protein